jgi:protoheme IX farnesyltransferase
VSLVPLWFKNVVRGFRLKNFRDYITLTKPRLNSEAILTALAGFYMGSGSPFRWGLMFFALLGTTAVAAGCGTLNQWFEAEADKKMKRTRKRPLPSGRVKSSDAFWYGMALSAAGLLVLFFLVNELAAFLGLAALVSYVVFYTPLKKITSLCTVVGAVPGAIPPMMGWAAAQNHVGPEGWVLFAILFFWQMPHFLAIGWMYRKDYARAGFPMLAVLDPKGDTTGMMAVVYAFGLLPVSLLPTYLHMAGHLYFWTALVLSSAFLFYSGLLARHKTLHYAKGLFWFSITYLPVLFGVMVLDKA